jgi:broad specificity phosphatase PhoE
MLLSRVAALAGLLALLMVGTACSTSPSKAAAGVTTVYLVRHAEKHSDSRDPHLTDAGRARAEALAARLDGESLTAILTTNYQRTRETAAPVSKRQGIKPRFYDPGRLPELALSLQQQNGAILVVGHSNTTARLAELLGAPDFGRINEANEHDRLYVLALEGDRLISARLERYGKRKVPIS